MPSYAAPPAYAPLSSSPSLPSLPSLSSLPPPVSLTPFETALFKWICKKAKIGEKKLQGAKNKIENVSHAGIRNDTCGYVGEQS